MNIYCDIDGTLTNDGEHKYGTPNLNRIKIIKELAKNLDKKYQIVIWSGNGREYAEEFCKIHELSNCIALGKPHLIIDDNPNIRPNWNSLIRTPEYLEE